MNRLNSSGTKQQEVNLVIVSHGVTMRVFLMRWFKWTVEQFENLRNPKNCEIRVMQQGEGGEYSLLVHHTREELEEWGLNDDMIKDQERRKYGKRERWINDECVDHWPWSGFQFFDTYKETVCTNKELEQREEEKMTKDEECYFMVNGNGHDIELDNSETPLDVGSTHPVE